MTGKEGFPVLLGRDPEKLAQKSPDEFKVIGEPEKKLQVGGPMIIGKKSSPGGVEPKYPMLAGTRPKPGELNPSFSEN